VLRARFWCLNPPPRPWARDGQETLPLSILPDRLFQTISATETSQGVVVLVEPRQWMLDDLFRGATLVVVLDGVQDPGNAGAIVRAAEAFGATAVVFGRGSVSPFNPKTLRGSAGSLFRMPFVHGIEAAEVAAACDQRGVKRFAAMPSDDRAPRDLTGPCALIIGSEAHGVSEALRTGATPITIPTEGVESLNAAMAAGILLYEARRQRSVCP